MSQFRRTLWDSLHFSTNLRLSQLIPRIAWGRGAGCHTHPGGPCWGPQSQPPPAESGKGTGGGGGSPGGIREAQCPGETDGDDTTCLHCSGTCRLPLGISLISTKQQKLPFGKRESTAPAEGSRPVIGPPTSSCYRNPDVLSYLCKRQRQKPKPKPPERPAAEKFQRHLRDKAGQRANSKRQWLLRSGASAGTSARGQTPLPSSLAWNAAWPSAPPPGGPAAGLTSGKVQAGGRRAGLRVRCPSPWSPPHPLF